MCPMTRYPMLQPLLSPFRRSQQKTLALVIAAMAEVAQAASIAVAGHLAVQLGIPRGSALTRFYRLLRKVRSDEPLRTTQLLRVLHPERKPLRLASDWTEWHHALRRRCHIWTRPRCPGALA